MLTFKALNNQAPDYISELLTLFKLCHALRSSCQTLLAVPKTKMKLIARNHGHFEPANNYQRYIVLHSGAQLFKARLS